ncbi:hypothetical protein ACJ5H2_13415 [Nocardioides sp. R1-1]|uniref:hypothetical protein n=1 Tax=Nocardioides sp. R1-1 TaxID=3383502 RepID=UPI0038D13372
MPRFTGPQRKGAAADARAIRRAEAEARNANTLTERTRAYRLEKAARAERRSKEN